MDKVRLHNVELISINTHNPEASVKAIEYSCRGFEFSAKKIFSDRMPYNIVSQDIKHIRVDPFRERHAYSSFVIKELYKHIEAEFVMMIHDDGFIINPHLWQEDFLKYDYIGAPWPGSKENIDHGRVGNGGFCIRSKKLLEACKDMHVEEDSHDDWMVGVTHNEYLRGLGFKFAPVTLAMKFSLELPIEECEYNLENTFGFHGKRSDQHIRKIQLLSE